MSEVHVKGLDELQKFLDQLPTKVETNIMRGGLRAGINVVKDEAIARVPVRYGILRDGLKVTTGWPRRGVVRASLKTTGKHNFIALWIEFGTKAHEIGAKIAGSLFFGGIFSKGVSHPGAKPHPFMRPAMDTKAAAAVIAVGEYVKKRLATKEGLDTADIVIEEDVL